MQEWIGYIAERLSGLVAEIIAAVVILLIGFIAGGVLGKLTKRVLHELEVDRIVKQTAKIKASIEKLASRFVAYFVYFIAVIAALNQLGLTTTILHMVAAAVLIVIGVSVMLGVKDFIPNFLAGIHIQKKGMIKKGDVVRIRGTEGKVAGMDMTEIKLKTRKGDIIFFPNSLVIKEKVVKPRK